MRFYSNLSMRDRSRRNTRKIDPDAPKLKFQAQGFVGGRWTIKVFWARAAEATAVAPGCSGVRVRADPSHLIRKS